MSYNLSHTGEEIDSANNIILNTQVTWYVDLDAEVNGDGSQASPYNTLASIVQTRSMCVLLKGGSSGTQDWSVIVDGSPFCFLVISSYGPGKAIFTGEMDLTGVQYADISNIIFTGDDAATNAHALSLDVANNIKIHGCVFTGDDGEYGIFARANVAGEDIYNIEIYNNEFYGLDTATTVNGAVHFRLLNVTSRVHDIYIHDNIFHDLSGWGINFNGAEAVTVGNEPYGVKIVRNIFHNNTWGAFKMVSGIDTYVAYNIATNNGTDVDGNATNCFQLHRQLKSVTGTIVEYNQIYGTVDDSATIGDGSAVICDWQSWTPTADHNSDGVIVRFNTFVDNYNGVGVWGAENTEVYGNIILGGTLGIRMGNSTSTGNIFRNNTLINNTTGMETNSSAATFTYHNNTISGSTTGLDVITAPTTPTHNAWYDNTTDYEVGGTPTALPGTDNVTTDPLLTSEGELQTSSPLLEAGTGTDYEGMVSLFGMPFTDIANIGAYPGKGK